MYRLLFIPGIILSPVFMFAHASAAARLFRGCLGCFVDYYTSIFSRLKDFRDSRFFQLHKESSAFCKVSVQGPLWGNIRREEAFFISALVSASAPAAIFEFGTFSGFSTAHLAVNAPQGCRVYTIDLPENTALPESSLSPHQAYDDLLTVKLKDGGRNTLPGRETGPGRITRLYGDTMDYDFSAWYGRIDLCFIDACHSYKYVKSDSENAFRMLKEGGIIVWHDFDINHYDVFRYLNGLSGRKRLYSVPGTSLAVYFNGEDAGKDTGFPRQ